MYLTALWQCVCSKGLHTTLQIFFVFVTKPFLLASLQIVQKLFQVVHDPPAVRIVIPSLHHLL